MWRQPHNFIINPNEFFWFFSRFFDTNCKFNFLANLAAALELGAELIPAPS